MEEIVSLLWNRDFYADRPNQKWVTAVTKLRLFGQKLYLSPILDFCSRDLISCTISKRTVIEHGCKAFETISDGTGLLKQNCCI